MVFKKRVVGGEGWRQEVTCGLPHLVLLLHLGDQLLPLSCLAHAHHDEALAVPLGQQGQVFR